jgi:lipopolysaccharide transport system ATP-binding protein
MANLIIEVRSLSKKFIINHEASEKYSTLRDEIARKASRMFKGGASKQKNNKEEFWALRDVSFDVQQGDRVGIIGRNGAGKSTLLKLMSRITSPSSGRITIRGRVASLLEVGTGFHPELTGRENVFLNGAILGMGRMEIKKKFDEIVDFAEVEKFLDTPVKRYSSGMYVRLAFAVAAHLEPEILVVDEVLAVGDAQFQKKCLGKMEDVSRSQGRTVLFVSHQMGTIAQLCQKAIYLNKGSVASMGPTASVIQDYLGGGNQQTNKYLATEDKPVNAYFKEIYTVNGEGSSVEEFGFNESVYVRSIIRINKKMPALKLGITLQNIHGVYISTSIFDIDGSALQSDTLTVDAKLPASIIAPNSYYFRLALFNDSEAFEILENVCGTRIIDTGTPLSKYEGINYGSVVLDIKFDVL